MAPDDATHLGPRVYRSPLSAVGGVIVLVVGAFFAVDTVLRGSGPTLWIPLAVIVLVCALAVTLWIRPALAVDPQRILIRNPFRTIEIPWSRVRDITSRYSLEVAADNGRRYSVWAIPMSLRARRKRLHHGGLHDPRSAGLLGGSGRHERQFTPPPQENHADAVARDLREYWAQVRPAPGGGEVRARWFWPAIAVIAGALAMLLLVTVW
ncbi:hypothetical protein TH66_12040 [Carbonactinospora thermoautotrophica]|uniref:Low molecular weight protein antigen 6 PH domain-containing protein n=1 Tax=Carbonactinospora thermoautotrophica TaxID=1469144 RepID=A0A132NIN7_9ACTN|nr:PH domain-containing protein [Carbonactinospora thermoautotrophica]KWX03577.1 hypothetical protein TH66_12040 [Carbonactinospora thermoautotrophica]KWX09582.1 hypothetical protein TR74_08710 [Carbonactinospora thermoautotrophica]